MKRLGLQRRRPIPVLIPEHTAANENEEFANVSIDRSTPTKDIFSTSATSETFGSQQTSNSSFVRFLRKRRMKKGLSFVNRKKAKRRWRVLGFVPPRVGDSTASSSDHGNSSPTSISVPLAVSTSMEGDCEPNHDNDSFSVFSNESLLSAWSTDDEESIDEKCHGLERMSRTFEIRDRTFDRITAQKRDSYRAMLMENELASREQIMHRHRLRFPSVDDGEKQPAPKGSFRILNHLIFEGHHTLGGIWAVICCCLGSCTFYYGFEVLISNVINFGVSRGVSRDICNVILIATSLLLMRLNGYLWEYINHESYRLVKFDMHNRLQLGYFDARVMKWLGSPRLATQSAIINTCAFYGVYLGITFFYFKLMGKCENFLWTWYAWKEQAVAHFLNEPVVGKPQFCEAILSMEQPWYEKAVAYYVCTDQDVAILYFSFHALFLVIVSGAMASSGRNVFKLSI